MEKKDFQMIISTCNIIEKYKLYSINEKEIANKGYLRYITIILNIINKCFSEYESEVKAIDNIYKVKVVYNELEIVFVNMKNNLKLFLTIKNKENMNIIFILNEFELNIYIESDQKEYLLVKYKKNKELSTIEYIKNNIKEKRSVHIYNLVEIINYVSKNVLQDELLIWEKIKDFCEKMEKLFLTKK